jgi:hypothetical protein
MLQGRMPHKHQYKVQQSISKPTQMCMSIREQPRVIYTPCITPKHVVKTVGVISKANKDLDKVEALGELGLHTLKVCWLPDIGANICCDITNHVYIHVYGDHL